MTAPQLYGPEEVDAIPWPATPDGAYARAYLAPMLREGARAFVENVETRLMVLVLGDRVLPVTVNEQEWDNCYVCAPYNHYVDYAKEELRTLNDPMAEGLLGAALDGIGGVLRLGEINRVVHVNNWLVSTNLYPPLDSADLGAITALLSARFPDHALIFRSINTVEGSALRDAFLDLGYMPIASRQLYYQRPADPEFYDKNARKIWKRDLKLLDSGAYTLVGPEGLTADDLPRILEVYNLLYLDKYSLHNPRYTLRYLEQALADETLSLRALRNAEGRIDGAVGFFVRHGAMTTPLFGYDTKLPQSVGLYRMLSAVTYREAKSRGLLLNQSSGAGNFKRTRGGRANIEVSMVHHQHLWPHRRLAWEALAQVINGVAVPLLKKYKL